MASSAPVNVSTTIIPAPDPQLLNDMLNHNVK